MKHFQSRRRLPTFVSDPLAPGSDRVLAVSSVTEALRALVFATWTERLLKGWGPLGEIRRFCEVDLRPGGAFKTIMRAPDGTELPPRGFFSK